MIRLLMWLCGAGAVTLTLAAYAGSGHGGYLLSAVALVLILPVTYWLGRRSAGRRSR